jgi:hypothetical protein
MLRRYSTTAGRYRFGNYSCEVGRQWAFGFTRTSHQMVRNVYDGHTLATVIPGMEALVGNAIQRVIAHWGSE